MRSTTSGDHDERNDALARTAATLARGGWALISVACGVALALAQYASLADGDPDRLDAAATIIVCGGVGLALLSWLWWGIAHVRLWRDGYAPRSTASAPGHALLAFFLWIALAVGGAAIMAAGGNADSIAPPALLALGLGCACTIGGFLGLFQTCGRWFAADLREDRQVRAAVRAAAAAQGRVVREPSRAASALAVLGFIVPATAMVGCYAVGPWIAALLHAPLAVGVAVVIVPGALICFPALAAFVNAHTRTHELVAPREARAYSYRAAAMATAGIVAVGVLPLMHLGLLVVVVFIGLAYLANRLRQRYLHRE